MEVIFMEIIEGLGARLKELRDQREMSMEMVVYDIGMKYNIELTKGHLSKWENGKCNPSLRMAKYLCLYYNVSLDYLLGLTDTKAPAAVLARKK